MKMNLQFFAPALDTVIINFDDNIIKVYDNNHIWTTSGQEVDTSYNGNVYTFTYNVTLKDGYVLSTVTSQDSHWNIVSFTNNTFTVNAPNYSGGQGGTFTLTSKEATIDINLNENKTTKLATKEKYVDKNIAVNVQDVFTYNQPESITKISSTEQKGLRYNIKGTNNYGDDGYIEFCNGSTYEQEIGTGCGASLKFYPCSDTGDNAAVDIYDANNKLAAVFLDGTLDNIKEKTVDLNLASGNQVVQDGYYQYQESPVDVPGDINYYFSKVTINKPATLLATNIKKDITIAGVKGTYEGEVLPAYTGLLRFSAAPTISLSNSTLTITAVANATSYAIYSNNALLTTITTTSVDLSTLITTSGTYTIYVIAKGTGYADSEKSNEVSYEVSSASGYNVSCSSYADKADTSVQTYYSNDNGQTWTEFDSAGGLGEQVSQVKFRITFPGGLPAPANPTISSTTLGMNFTVTLVKAGVDETSNNYILTKNVTDVVYSE